jgi:hypothetical protein
MQKDINISSQEIIFLHSDQIDISLLDQEMNIIFFTFNKIIIQSIDLNTDLIQSIKNTLFNDRNIGLYLEFLKDIILSYDDKIKIYLKSFSIHDNGFILRNELIYIPKDLKIKFQILQSQHDSQISDHLEHEKILEFIIKDYY